RRAREEKRELRRRRLAQGCQEKVEPDLEPVRVEIRVLGEVQIAMLGEVRKISVDRRLARELLELSASWAGQHVPLLPKGVAEDVGVEHVIGGKDLRLL